ncbi:hypothetical protein [Paenibacillus tianjinensis]|uniref:Uncharacterized protein n=1 Tax=Paenibacillus tianjinensis TaxID=2810347 RepID=A0ABX7L9Q6_9BACL|nr:hypothetical protein [Paenibacillus tianjinensis]QSF43454.1 hypothetical protein JRJ22_19515 [Paenibacillus tianjinensis]
MSITIDFGQEWISKESPRENFKIYGGTEYNDEFIWFWERANESAFEEFIIQKKGASIKELIKQGKNTYPYVFAGECNSKTLKERIKKYNMQLKI